MKLPKKHLVYFLLPLVSVSLLRQARLLRQDGEYLLKKSERLYRQIIQKDPHNIKVKIELARFYYSQRRWQDVLETLKGVSSKAALALKAMALARQGKFTQALENFDKVKFLSQPEYLYLYGLTLETKNLFARAQKVYGKIEKSTFAKLAQARLQALASVKSKENLPPYLQKLIKNSPGEKQFPDADSLVLLSEEEVFVKGKDSEIDTSHMVVRILNDKGKERWAELHLSYDSTYERVEIEQARVIKPNGEVVYVGRENIRDVSKYLGFPLYSNVRVRIISFPQIVHGAVIEYRAKFYRSKLIRGQDFSFTYPLEGEYPILKATFKLKVPKDTQVRFFVLNRKYVPAGITLSPKSQAQGKYQIYAWRFENIPQILPESNMVPESFINPALVISTFSSWQDIYKWWDGLYKDKLKPSAEMQSFIGQLVQSAKSDYEKARRIYEFCASKIRYVGVEYGEGGYEPHKAAEVFFNRYGDCKDQAILLVSLLRAAGLKAWPVLVPTKSVFDLKSEFPALYFNHAIAALELGKKVIFMDPTSFVASFGDLPLPDQGRRVLLFSRGGKIVRIPFQKGNALEINMDINIKSEDLVRIKRKVVCQGFYAATERYYLRFSAPSVVEQDIKEKMRRFSALSELVSLRILNKESLSRPPILSYEFLARSFLSQAKDLRIIPVLAQTTLDASWIAKDKRRFPLDLGGIYQVNLTAVINLPAHLKAEFLPADLNLETPWFGLYLNYKTQGAKKVIFKQHLEIKKAQVSISDYAQFKQAVAKALGLLKQQIILKYRP